MDPSKKFIIQIENQEWLYENEEEDLCSHGEIYFYVNGTIITQTGMDEDWGISESALALLRTIDKNYLCDPVNEEGLILHGCGAILMMGCPISIHWTVKHRENSVLLTDFVKVTTTDPQSGSVHYPGLQVALTQNEYQKEVVQFAITAKTFFENAKEKRMADDFDKEMHEEFWNEFNRLLENSLLS